MIARNIFARDNYKSKLTIWIKRRQRHIFTLVPSGLYARIIYLLNTARDDNEKAKILC